MKRIVLASASPRRKALLSGIGLKFKTESSNFQEEVPRGLEPHDLVRSMSLKKAQAVAARHRNALVIAADTVGVLDGQILGKPHSVQDARAMLEQLSGWSHTVITGFTIIDTGDNKTLSRSVETRVYFKRLTQQDIDAYVNTGEPLDKAGAYALQGLGGLLVERIEGDCSNVIGLPLSALAEALEEFGVNVLEENALRFPRPRSR